jgi:hypothetical protein
MKETQLLDDLVPPFTEPGDWNDVLRRARHRPRPRGRMLVVIAVAVTAFGVGPALAYELFQHDATALPAAADRNNVAVIMEPRTGRVVLQVAPWKSHKGFCYALLGVRAGCVPQKASGTLASWPPLLGWSFDARIRSGTGTTIGGKTVPLTVAHFDGRINVTLFLQRRVSSPPLKRVVLRDAHGAVLVRLRLRR